MPGTEAVVSPSGVALIGGPAGSLAPDQVRAFVREQLERADLRGRSVCVLVPDATRTCPLPLLLSSIDDTLRGRASRVTVLVALGTHAPLGEQALAAHLGLPPGQLGAHAPNLEVRNHAWWEPSTFAPVGTISAARIDELSGGLLRRSVDVEVNRAVLDHEVTLIVGPVFPHEVVGYSGGNKYLFPGVSGRAFIDVSHWLGALLTNVAQIGVRGQTPVRALIDEAASMVPGEHLALCLVTGVGSDELHAVTFGDPVEAWDAATAVAELTHVRRLDAPVRRVLALIPGRYADLWTGAKGFYKVEPVVADGGQVVLFAPHIHEVSVTHPRVQTIGYHCRDYFVGQWERFRDEPWGDLAHSTHLRGSGTYDPVRGEHDRLVVTLATGIPEDVTRSMNLDYLDPSGVDPAAWASDPDTLVVPDAGEVLYRLP